MSAGANDAAAPALDLPAYLARIGQAAPARADAAALHALHLAHAQSIPFENLDILLGRGVRLDLPSLHAKLVDARRGGYCFEQNLLFAAALERLGFAVVRLAARVRFRATRLLPRTHMLLRVEADGASWLADVGFGGEGLLLPVPLAPGAESRQGAWTYRLRDEGGQLVLESRTGDGWHDLYAFTLEPQLPVDFEPLNHYVSTHPQSRFTHVLTVQQPGLEVRRSLRNRTLVVERGFAVEERTLPDDDAILAALAGEFGLAFPAGTAFRFDESFA